jgi:superfamily II DNA/RNA helicase
MMLAGEQEQSFRLKTMELFRQYKIRILVSTDLVCAVI